MAIKEVRVCDLTGNWHSEQVPVETVEFALDGDHKEIDLVAPEAAQLRKLLADYVAAGRKVSLHRPATASKPARASATTASDRIQNQAIREWARKHGGPVSDRGRIPAFVLEAYHANDPSKLTRDLTGVST